MPPFTPIVTTNSLVLSSNPLLKLPEEVRRMIYNLCIASGTAQTQIPPRFINFAPRLSGLPMDDTEFWLRNGYVLQNTVFHMTEVCDGDIAMHHADDDDVYHKGHKMCDWDGKGTSYSIVLEDDDPDDLSPHVEEWFSRQGGEWSPCDCL